MAQKLPRKSKYWILEIGKNWENNKFQEEIKALYINQDNTFI